MRDEAAVLALAVQFLTRLPVGSAATYSAPRMAASPAWYPFVGMLVGLLAAGAYLAALTVWTQPVAILLALAAALLVTGALHEDGLADLCDGLGGGRDRAQALEIMRDSRIGTFGVLGLGLGLAVRVAALLALPALAVPVALIAGHGASRASMLAALAGGRYARSDGRAAPVSGGIGPARAAFGYLTGVAALAIAALAFPPVAIACAALGLVLANVLTRRVYGRRLGGYTGDCLGAVQQTGEIAVYLGLAACL